MECTCIRFYDGSPHHEKCPRYAADKLGGVAKYLSTQIDMSRYESTLLEPLIEARRLILRAQITLLRGQPCLRGVEFMTCPFCHQPIIDGVVPFTHMLFCKHEETKLWEGRLNRIAESFGPSSERRAGS